MYQSIIFIGLFLFSIFSKTPCYSASTPTPTPKPYVSISKDKDSYYQSSGIYSYSSVQEAAIYLKSHSYQGDLKIDIYQADLNSVLKYLTHDDKNYQTNTKVDFSKFTYLKQLSSSINASEDKKISLPLDESGIFYVQVKSGAYTDSTFIIRSTFGSFATEAKDTLVVWSLDFKTKKSLSSGKVSLYSLQNQASLLDSANLDGEGVASVSLNNNPDIAIIEANNSLALIPLNLRYLNSSYSYTSFSRYQVGQRFYIFTSRPLYQPGDTVDFKVIARQDDDSRYSMPSGSATITVNGQKTIYKNTYSFDSNGVFGGSFKLPANAKTGEYQISINEKIISHPDYGDYETRDESINFQVETYRKPEYFLTAAAVQDKVVRGSDLVINLSGSYYSGQPLNNAKVDYLVRASNTDYYYPYFSGWNGDEITNGSLTLDKKGNAKLTIPTNENDSKGQDQIFFVEFTYNDASGNPATTGVNVYVHAGQYSVKNSDGYYHGGKTNQVYQLPLQINTNAKNVSQNQEVEFEVTRKWWEKIYQEGKKYPRYEEKNETILKKTITSDNSGKILLEFTPQNYGSYLIKAQMKDDLDNQIIQYFSAWIYDDYQVYSGSEDSSLLISTDKEVYLPNDTVKLNVKSLIPNRDFYLSVKRGYQDRYQIIKLQGEQATVDIPLKPQDLPNIYLSITSFDDDNLVYQTKAVSINKDSKKISYQLITDKKDYAPGDEVTVDITATDLANNPVETNFALWAVDKSIYALADDNKKDVFDRFWEDRYNDTNTSHSLAGIYGADGAEKGGCFLSDTKILMADGSQKNIDQIKVGDYVKANSTSNSKVTAVHSDKTDGYYIINGHLKVTSNHLMFINQRWQTASSIQIGDQLSDPSGKTLTVNSLEYLLLPAPVYNFTVEKYHTYFADNILVHNQKGAESRTKFSDTAYWNLSVNTNSAGKAQVKFRLPDNLTTWVIAVLGSSADTKVGTNTTEIKTSKNLVIRPSIPNVLNLGDEINLSAIVNNFSEKDIYSQISLTTDAGQISGPTLINQKVPSSDFALVSWKLKVDSQKPLAKLEFKVKDNSGNSDSVVQNLPIKTVGYYQNYSEFKVNQTAFNFSPPTTFDKNKSESSLYLSSNLLGSLPSAIKYLANYPYGCTEQTTSSLISKLIAQKYFSIGITGIQAGLDRLESTQNNDGGWGWWGDRSNSFLTAYVFRALNLAQSLGYQVDESLYQSALKNLSSDFEESSIKEKAIKSYGLSSSSNPKNYLTLTANLDQLPINLLSMAIIANQKAGITDNNQNGVNILLSKAITTENQVHWSSTKDQDYFSDSFGDTALAIQALLATNNQEIISKAANYLTKNRQQDYWSNSFSTAQILLALSAVSSVDSTVSYQLKSGDKIISSGTLNKAKNFVEIPLNLATLDLKQPLTLTKISGGEIYSTFNQKYWIPSRQVSAVSNHLSITKEYRNHAGEEYNLIPGDLVDVVLTINTNQLEDNLDYPLAIIEDHLPAGMIPVNTHLKNQSSEENNYRNYQAEYLPDGIIMPLYLSGNKTFTVSYQARVINSGNFVSPSAFFSLMYSPEVWARSSSEALVIDTQLKINPAKQASRQISQLKNKSNIFILIGLTICLFLVFKYVKKKNNN